MADMTEAQRLSAELNMWARAAAADLTRLEHNNQLLMNALWKACGDNAELVKEIIESQGELK
jgi:hypothetical protein